MTCLARITPASWPSGCVIALGAITALAGLLGAGDGRESPKQPGSTPAIARTLPMQVDPVLEQTTPEIDFDRRNISLWLEALKRPEFDTRMDAIEAFAEAHRQHVRGLDEALPQIQSLLSNDPHAEVRFAAARALIEFEHRPAAAALLQAVSPDRNPSPGLVLTVDRALAAWGDSDAIPFWIARVKDRSTRPSLSLSAIQSLSTIRAQQAREPLESALRDRKLSPVLRLEAAKALARIAASGHSALAAELAAEPGQWGALFALMALGAGINEPNTSTLDSTGIALVDSLTTHPDPRVRSHAIRLLGRADPARAVAKAQFLSDTDDQVRLETVRVLALAPDSPGAIDSLAGAMNDASEPVRAAAGDGLRRAWIRDPANVQAAIERGLSGGNWREAEQAAMLAGDLDIAALGPKLMMLVGVERAEVRLAAVTALRQLDLAESLPGLVARAEVLAGAAAESAKVPDRFTAEGQELAQIFVAFAQQRYAPSLDLLRKCIPKRAKFHTLSREAAFYALGRILESKPNPELASQLLERAEDNVPIDPEAASVRRAAIIALARMNARETLPALRDIYEAENTIVTAGGASRWAIMHLESSKLPPCRPVVLKAGPFFLESISPERKPGQP